ncbi:MAG: rhodanese-like domain-containing protein [Leptolyngbyaceae bacterium]|nr:rhodanese-like domain-containing protein [Leptolyngbyaceae bacterium]
MTSIQKQPMNPVLLTPSQLKSRQNQLLVIDVRSGLEYWLGHIPGAQRLNKNRILQEIPKDRAIALTCLSGHRSVMAAQWLVSQGYRQVHNLQGEWHGNRWATPCNVAIKHNFRPCTPA